MKKQNKIDDIRKWMKELQSERYAIENAALKELEEYVKQLYLTVLCTVVQYHNEQTEEQMLLLRRIICGMGVEDNVTEYMRKALEIDENQMQEFRSMIGDGDTKYYFAIDALLLAVLGSGERDNYEYLAELLELLDISKSDLECLCTVAKSIVMQDSEIYDEAKDMMSEDIGKLDFSAYVCSFYSGIIVESEKLLYYHSVDKDDANVIELRDSFTAGTVVFSNLNIICASDVDIWFHGCSRVIFMNCVITGGGGSSFVFEGCESLEIFSCKFNKFEDSVLYEMCVGKVLIDHCEFSNCMKRIARRDSDWKPEGGVIKLIGSLNDNGVNKIVDSSFEGCGIYNRHNYCSSAVISNCKCEVINSSFRNCWGYNNNGRKDPENLKRTLFLDKTVNQGNKIVNSANFS